MVVEGQVHTYTQVVELLQGVGRVVTAAQVMVATLVQEALVVTQVLEILVPQGPLVGQVVPLNLLKLMVVLVLLVFVILPGNY